MSDLGGNSQAVITRSKAILTALGCAIIALIGLLPLGPGGCSAGGGGPATSFSAQLRIVDEAGQPIPGARIELADSTLTTNANGKARLPVMDSPVLAVVRADGYLSEPVPLGWESANQTVEIALLSDNGGTRLVLHFGGDVMFGRRYEQPTSGDPLIPLENAAAGAISVVSNVKRAFLEADLRALNLETVVSELDDDAAYPGKRFLLRSHPETLAALVSIGVDVVSLANNHARDWMDTGVTYTVQALTEAGIPFFGAADTGEQATIPYIAEKKDTRIGMLGYTTVTGSFVNDNYPLDGDAIPADLDAEEAWLYEYRDWGYTSDDLTIPQQDRRLGGVWTLFAERESSLDDSLSASVWASMVGVYPEMQDWVARRGHGGAAKWGTSEAEAQIKALRSDVDILVVQLHSGFQFLPVASATVRNAARTAIDAGADIVIAHHPHVLQGAEWYKGHLIIYSLGNFIFDQDFLSTFASGFVRTVWEAGQLVQARFIPLELAGYKPTPIVDNAARRVLRTVWESSVIPAISNRDTVTGFVRTFEYEVDAATQSAQMLIEHNTGRFVTGVAGKNIFLDLEPGIATPLVTTHLIPAQLGLMPGTSPEVLIGRDLFGWGRFEDETADLATAGDTHWSLEGNDKAVIVGAAATGRGFLRLHRDDKNQSKVLARPVARIPLALNRLYREDPAGAVPVDPPAEFSLNFAARLSGNATAEIRMDVYHFDDTNPTEDPSSERLARVEIPIPDLSSRWQDIQMSFDPAGYSDTVSANMIMIYFMLSPPAEGDAELDIDNFNVIEWRQASAMPNIYGAYTHVTTTGQPQTIGFTAMEGAISP